MKTLLIMRHAKSSWGDAGLGDFDRPLNKRGQRDAPRMGQLLTELDLLPSLMVSSSAKRARATASLVAEASGFKGPLRFTEEIYLSPAIAFVEVLQQQEDQHDRVMTVAHNPGSEQIIGELTGEYVRMPTAALAVIQLPIDRWTDLTLNTQGKLQATYCPKELMDD